MSPGNDQPETAPAVALIEQRTGRRFGIVADPHVHLVRIHFGGAPLSWLGLTAAEALQLSAALRKKAGEILERDLAAGAT